MALAAETPQKKYSLADLQSWDTQDRYELIDGTPVMLASPTGMHQLIASRLGGQLYNFLRDKPCEVLYAPLDVRLFEKEGDRPEDVDTVVRPDIMVVCDLARIDDHGYRGAPKLVIEILSPSTSQHDRSIKYQLYEEAGVPEYWIIDPVERSVEVFLLAEGRYVPKETADPEDRVPVTVLDGCATDMSLIFI